MDDNTTCVSSYGCDILHYEIWPLPPNRLMISALLFSSSFLNFMFYIYAIGFVIALFGAVGFLISGSYLNANLPLSIGFLNIPAFLIFFPITAFMARLVAKASHRINKKKMTKYFGLFLVVIGTRFLYEYFKL